MTTEGEVSPVKKTEAPASKPLGVHIYLYLLIAMLLLCIATFVGVGLLVADPSGPRDWMFYATCTAPVLLLAALWLALKRCSAADLSGFRGLLFITAYMSIGVGSYSVIVAVPAVRNDRHCGMSIDRGGESVSGGFHLCTAAVSPAGLSVLPA
jgi:hypothetical protein